MITFSALSVYQGSQPLIRDASLMLTAGSRVAVVGRNGCGKSTLFSLILGQRGADSGSLSLPGGLRLAHMAQDTPALDCSAVDYVLDGDTELRAAQAALEVAEAAEDGAAIALAHGRIQDAGGYDASARAGRLLEGLGFQPGDLDRTVKSFSGGWRIRLNLARALMKPSDLLLLDEPTNHLDLDAVLWLQNWLLQYAGTLLLISHDRDFMDALATHVLSFEQQQLILYTGNYSRFEGQRASRLAQQAAAHGKQQQRIAEIQRFVSRFGAKATKARQAQSRLRELERMELIAPAHADSPFSFRIPCHDKMSEPLLALKQASLGYQGKAVLNGVNLILYPGARVGLLGANGQGKSTLIKSLVGDLPLVSGERQTGEHLRIGYFSQHQLEALDPASSAFELMRRRDPDAREQSIRDYLGGFDFGGEAADKPLADCSGGERARVALALIAWQRPNLLLLDEPTNHLDLEMRHALNMALQDYPGALVLVTHDRHLMRALADDLILVAGGRADEYRESLETYEKSRLSAEVPVSQGDNAGKNGQAQTADRKQKKRAEAERRQRLSPLRKRISEAEKRMEKLSTQLDSISEQLADSELYSAERKAELATLMSQRQTLQNELETAELEWMSASEELERLESEPLDEV